MTFPTVTPLPSAPSRTQTPDAFATTADAFVAALPDLVTDVNAAGAYIDTKTISVGNDFQGAYSAGTTYTTGQSVLYNDLFYLSLVDSNTGNTPDSSPSQWVEIAGAAGGGGGGTHSFVASGAISNGDLVGLNTDGTVSVLRPSFGAETALSTGTQATATVFDSNSNKVVIAYSDFNNSAYGTAIVGTVSGTSITFGTPVVFESASSLLIDIAFDSTTNQVVIAYRDSGNSNYGTAIVGAVSGTSITFGTPAVFYAGLSARKYGIVYDSNSAKVVVSYDILATNTSNAVVGTVSGTSISFGTAVQYAASSFTTSDIVFDSNSNKVVIAYDDTGNSDHGTAIVGTVSGTSISFGTPVVFESANTASISAVFDSSSNKVVIAYRDEGNSNRGTAIVGTVSGTSISFGTAVVFETNAANHIGTAFDSVNNKIIIAYEDSGSSGNYIQGTVSGTSVSFEDSVEFNNTSCFYISPVYDINSDKIVITYADAGNSNLLTARVCESEVSGPWVGIAAENISDATTGSVTVVGGVNAGQTGLTVGSKYYLQADATLGTTVVSGHEIGRALSATELLITQGSTA